MSTLINRISSLIEEINNFDLGRCGPSDDPDMQTAYTYGYRDLIKRFFASAKRIENAELQEMIAGINTNAESIYDAYDLRAEVQAVLDFLEDFQQSAVLREKSKVTVETANSLSRLIIECLRSESANYLPTICIQYGLADGTREEAFASKANYIKSRIIHFTPEQTFELAKKLKGKYADFELDQVLQQIDEYDDLSVISKFNKIKETILNEIKAAKFLIWVAVAWLTDKDLANALYIKSKEGLNVQIILNDDKTNLKLSNLAKYFEVHKVPQIDRYNTLMHHKFCMIDFRKVIHGSYNWTVKANYNNETISVVDNRETAETFALEFIYLKGQLLMEKQNRRED